MSKKIIVYVSVFGKKNLDQHHEDIKKYCEANSLEISSEMLVDSEFTYDAKSRRVFDLIDALGEDVVVLTIDLSTLGRGIAGNKQILDEIMNAGAKIQFVSEEVQELQQSKDFIPSLMATIKMLSEMSASRPVMPKRRYNSRPNDYNNRGNSYGSNNSNNMGGKFSVRGFGSNSRFSSNYSRQKK